MVDEILRVENLNCFYGGVHAIKSISIEVMIGEIVCIIGSNGAGKSTTLRSISGLNKDVRGTIEFKGKEILGLPAYEIVQAGIVHVPERRRIFPRLTVRENLLMGGYLQKEQRKERATLEIVFTLFPRLRDRLHQKGGTLSGGEQQMLAVGRGLMSQPTLLLLDEPSLGLAPIVVESLFGVFLEIKPIAPILLVEQNARMALRASDRGYVLETGRMAFWGSVDELKSNDKLREAYLGRTLR